MKALASIVSILALAAAGPAAADAGWSKRLASGLFGDQASALSGGDARSERSFGWFSRGDDDGKGNGNGKGRGKAHLGHDRGKGHTPGHGGGHCKGHVDDFCPVSP